MRVLILSCNTGQGHNSASAAMKEVFDQHGVPCEIADALKFASRGVSGFLSWGHSFVYRHLPGLFRWGYRYSETHSGVFREGSPVYRFLTGGAEQLYQYCLEGQYDTIISAHVFASMMLDRILKKHSLDAKTYFVATDYTCSPNAVQEELDYFFIPAQSLTAEFSACGIPEEKLVPTGIPVRKTFFASEDREATERCPGHRHLLMMCGSMGCGPMKALAKHLANELSGEQELTIVCGTNERLRKNLSRRFQDRKNIHVLGYAENIPHLMDSADLYLTKPGGISVTEAAAKRLPMVFVDAVAGCESYNLRYYTDRGAAVTAKDPETLARLCGEILRDEARLEDMKRAFGPEPCENGAWNIYDFVTQKAGLCCE